MRNMKHKPEVKVLRNYDGFNIDVIETISRTLSKKKVKEYEKRDGRRVQIWRDYNHKYCSYKREQYYVFYYPNVGLCISIK